MHMQKNVPVWDMLVLFITCAYGTSFVIFIIWDVSCIRIGTSGDLKDMFHIVMKYEIIRNVCIRVL